MIRRMLQNLALMLASLTLMLLIFEGGIRIAGYRPIYEVYSKPSQFWRHDPLLGWSHEPGAEGEFIGPRPWPIEFEARVQINSSGLRGPEIRAPGDGELRVLFLGDSMVAAFEVAYPETFVALAQGGLEERLDSSVLTINAGVRGYGTDQALLYFRERGIRLQPDVVVHLHAANDSRNNRTVHRMRRPFGKPAFALAGDGGLQLMGAPVPAYPKCSQYGLGEDGGIARIDSTSARVMCQAQMQLFDHSALFTFATLRVPWDPAMLGRLYRLGAPGGDPKAGTSEQRRPGWQLTTALVRELAREVRDAGAGFVLASQEVTHRSLDLEVLAADGIIPIDLTVVTLDDPTARFKNDSHFNVKGHRIAADLLLPAIEQALATRRAAELSWLPGRGDGHDGR